MTNIPDLITLYKAGEQPRRIWAIDVPAWEGLGWSRTEPQEAPAAEPVEESEATQETTSTVVEESTPPELTGEGEQPAPTETEDQPPADTTPSRRRRAAT